MCTFKWRAWLFDCNKTIVFGEMATVLRCFRWETKYVSKRMRMDMANDWGKWTNQTIEGWILYALLTLGLGSALVHLFSSYFNHRWLTVESCSFQFPLMQPSIWPVDFRFDDFIVAWRFSIKFSSRCFGSGFLGVYFGQPTRHTHTQTKWNHYNNDDDDEKTMASAIVYTPVQSIE